VQHTFTKTGKLILEAAQDEVDGDRGDDERHDPGDDINAGRAENAPQRFRQIERSLP